MKQFDVCPNPIGRARRAFPLVAVLQSDLAETGHDRVVAFLAPKTSLPSISGRLMPIVNVNGRDYVLLIPSLTNLPITDLKSAVGNVAPHRDRIVEALDWLFLGV
jgi:toxin CcdB